jgi:ligand-binding sensor domain-containing protein/signal transduction histidine kinase
MKPNIPRLAWQKSAVWQACRWLDGCRMGCIVCLWLLFGSCSATAATATANATSNATPTAPPSQPRDFPFTQLRFEDVNASDAIPEGVITALAQDSKGFLWVGTQNGVLRFDGYRFRTFVHDDAIAASLPGNYVLSLCAAKDGALWVGTISDGLARFDPKREQFTSFVQQPNQSSQSKQPNQPNRSAGLSGNRIAAMVEDAKGGLWVGTDHGLDYLPPGSSQFTHYRHDRARPLSLASDFIHALLLDRDGRLWVGSSNGLQRLADNGRDFVRVAGNEFGGKTIQALFQAKDGKLWVGSAIDGAAWIVPEQTITPLQWRANWLPLGQGTGPAMALNYQAIASITQAHDDQIWLGTYGGGINVVNSASGQVLHHLRHDADVPGSLAYDVVVPMLQDRSGLLWIGTWGNGLQYHDQRHAMVRLFRHGRHLPNSLSQPFVDSVLELANGQILLGLENNGIDIIDRQQGRIGGYYPEPGNGLPNGAIRALAQTPDGSLWAGTRDAGLLRLPPGGRVWQTARGLPGRKVKKLLVGKDGSVWAGTDHGVAVWRGQAGYDDPPQFVALPDQQGEPMVYTVEALAEDRQGRIWAGSQNGLWLLEPGQRGWRGIHPEPGRFDSLSSDYISSLLVDKQGRLWVNTTKGILRLLPGSEKSPRFEHVSDWFGEQGKDWGANLMEDGQGRIWTEVAVIDPVKRERHLLGKVEGIDMVGIWIGAYGQTRDGMMMFGGPFGVALIDPARFLPWQYAPPVVVTGIKINQRGSTSGMAASTGNTAGSAEGGITLRPGARDFAVEFAALDYSDPKKNRYQYRLQGYDAEWISTDSEHRVASYGNLWPGNYTLQVRGSNRLGQWSPNLLQVPVRILPAFWQTGWFFAGGLGLAGSLIYFAIRWREQRLRARARQLQVLIDERTADVLRLGDIGRELAATLDMEQALSRVYQQVVARLDAAVFLIGMVRMDVLEFVYNVEHQQRLPSTLLALDVLNRPATLCVREQRELVFNQRAELFQLFGENLSPMIGEPMETIVYLPLLTEGQVIGCLSVQSPKANAYNPGQLEFLRILARYTAIALSNSAAHQEVTESHQELSAALEYLKETQAKLIQAERQQLSIDLHDNLSQTMTGVLLQLDTARTVLMAEARAEARAEAGADAKASAPRSLAYVDRATALARDGMTQTRQLLLHLRNAQSKPSRINLVDALKRDLPRLTVGTRISLEVVQNGKEVVLPAELELGLFRIAQEAVTNALRHAQARKVVVTIGFLAESISLSVEDDGKGFDPHSPEHQPGLGLLGMQQRASQLGGSLMQESAPGRGSRIFTTLPIMQESNS